VIGENLFPAEVEQVLEERNPVGKLLRRLTQPA